MVRVVLEDVQNLIIMKIYQNIGVGKCLLAKKIIENISKFNLRSVFFVTEILKVYYNLVTSGVLEVFSLTK